MLAQYVVPGGESVVNHTRAVSPEVQTCHSVSALVLSTGTFRGISILQ